VVLPRLTTPLSELLLAAARGTLDSVPAPRFSAQAAVGVVLAAAGYPADPVLGAEITGLDDAEAQAGVSVLHAATAERDGRLVTTGGRVLTVVGVGDSLEDARRRAYEGAAAVRFEGAQLRHDVATDAG
jgi:phosphoribosylamine--glycine ligase